MTCQLTGPKVAIYVPEHTLRDTVDPRIVLLGIDVYLRCVSSHKTKSENLYGPPGWGLDARLTTLLCKNIVAKSKEVKLLRKAVAQKWLFCQ
jgi:hypothetical protein